MANEKTLRSDRPSLVFHRQTLVKSEEKNVDDGVRFGNAFPRNMAGIFRSSTVKRGRARGRRVEERAKFPKSSISPRETARDVYQTFDRSATIIALI